MTETTQTLASAPKMKTAFKASRLTPTSFAIVEHSDIYGEQPVIYAKVVPDSNAIVVVDTGCGGATDNEEITVKSLREFLETVRIADNDDRPINPGGSRQYIVVLTHCHYDHIRTFSPHPVHYIPAHRRIVAAEQFAIDSPILASGHSPGFLSPEKLPKHSLCEDLDIPTPRYTPILVSHQHEIGRKLLGRADPAGQDGFGLIVLHTPGHTPDELALWDETERSLYVGDTLYEWAPIIFPNEGSIVDWLRTVDSLLELVGTAEDAKICCGHVTYGRPAREVLEASKQFMLDVISGKESVRKRFEKRGETTVQYVQDGHRYSLICPERLVLEARQQSVQ